MVPFFQIFKRQAALLFSLFARIVVMNIVEEFVRRRRVGDSEGASELLAPNAALGSPWGGLRFGDNVHDYLKEEVSFVKKGYLDEFPVRRIDDNTFVREFRFDRGMYEQGNLGYWFLRWNLPKWRELYFVKDGQIRLVVANKQPREKNFFKLWCGMS